MQADEEVGKIAQAVPVIISRTLELFVESLLKKSSSITNSRNAKTLSPSHLKQCIMSESRFDFLKDLVKTVPDISMEEGGSEAPLADGPSTARESSAHFPRSLDVDFPSILANGSEPNGHRALQRSHSLQPSTVSATAAPSQPPEQQQQHSQYHQLQQQTFYLNNYTNHHKPNSATHAKISRINSSPASATITSEQQQKPLPAPLNFPIQFSYNIDGSTSTGAIESPAVKIDYSKFALPATSPSIKIDLSSFNQQATKPSTSASGLIDEDYDDY
jgi:Dr1-associated corepressor